ncbi:hypothetical protein [Haloferula sp.]|uniref:phosphorylase family protein n=1 Tax=Haloferula sp. TaxID=2497595 RepID=UPI003C7323D0
MKEIEKKFGFVVTLLISLTYLLFASELRGNQIAFFYALDADFKELKRELGGTVSTIEVGGTSISLIKSKGLTVVAAAMKPGPVETAVTAEAVLGRFPCRFAISVGPVGSLKDSVKVSEWGFIDSLVPYQKVSGNTEGSGSVETTTILFDTEIRELFNHPNLSDWKPEDRPSWTASSGEKFIASSSERKQIQRIGGTEVVEMNLFGLDSALKRRRIKGVHLRVVSDHADESAHEDFLNFVESYDGLGGRLCADVLKRLAPDPNSPTSYRGLRSLIDEQK